MKGLLNNGLLIVAVTTCWPVHAQVFPCGGSEPGVVVVGQTQSGQGVGSIPLCQTVEQTQNSKTQAAQWESRWGAITADVGHGVVGSSSGAPDANAAEHEAVADCQAKGGSDCKVQISFANGCDVMLTGKKTFNLNWGATQAEATQKAIQTCAANDTDCQVYFSTCSPPARLQ